MDRPSGGSSATTFADDTTSGRWSTLLRGSRRVTIVARADDLTNFDWLLRLKREFLPSGVEARSTNILSALDLRQKAKKVVLHNVESYRIFIVDLYEQRRRYSAASLRGLEASFHQASIPTTSYSSFPMTVPLLAGLFFRRASHAELGLQAADIAAALASRDYERASDDAAAVRAQAVKKVFAHVGLNERWI